MNYTEESKAAIATTILNQLGGNKFKVMTGSKNFFYEGGTEKNQNVSLRMDLTKNIANVNRLQITLEADDTYTMYFYKLTINRTTFDHKITNEVKHEGVYADMLQKLFTETTGLYTYL